MQYSKQVFLGDCSLHFVSSLSLLARKQKGEGRWCFRFITAGSEGVSCTCEPHVHLYRRNALEGTKGHKILCLVKLAKAWNYYCPLLVLYGLLKIKHSVPNSFTGNKS